ncbi:hypothetical protein B932_2416 [Gluconobacter oxydans H24]|nr:hypothetical protein B932_2416 [Gluconobacter oxydans H24]
MNVVGFRSLPCECQTISRSVIAVLPVNHMEEAENFFWIFND